MIEDILFSKIYKNKRYLTKLIEAKKDDNPNWEKGVETSYPNLISSKNGKWFVDTLKAFTKAFSYNISSQPSKYYLKKDNNYLYIFFYFNDNKPFKLTREIFERDSNRALENAKTVSMSAISRMSPYINFQPITQYKTDVVSLGFDPLIKNSTNKFVVVNSVYTGGIKIDLETFDYNTSFGKVYVYVGNDASISFNLVNEALKMDGIKSTTIQEILAIAEKNISKSFSYKSEETEEYEENIPVKSNKIKNKEKPSLQKYNAEIVDNADEIDYDEVSMHLRTARGNNKNIIPEILTADIVTDEGARNYMNVCNMIENNVTNIEDKILDGKLNQAFIYNHRIHKGLFDKEKDEYTKEISKISTDKEKYADNIDSLLSTQSSEDKSILRQVSVKVCEAYLDAMKKSKDLKFTEDYKHSKFINYNLHNYLVEILSPLAVIANEPESCTWLANDPEHGIEEFKKHVKIPLSTTNFIDSAYISFPKISNFPLADSVIYINGIRTYLSTKGGANGRGSNASIATLSEFVYGKDGKTLTYLADGLKKDQTIKDEYAVFEELLKGSVSKMNWKKISQYTGYSRVSELQEWINDRKKTFTKIIMTILQAQAFQFMQVMCTPTNTENDFHFTYDIQYPAVFNGDVKIILPSQGKGRISFHIEGKDEIKN